MIRNKKKNYCWYNNMNETWDFQLHWVKEAEKKYVLYDSTYIEVQK
jgi:hypothetical protein